jgi:hypothetical protein
MAKLYEVASNLPPAYYPAIGELIFRWAQLEYQMQEIIWRALSIDNKRGRTLTVGKDARALASILRTLTLRWITHPTDKQLTNHVAKCIGSVADTRNMLAHGSWQYPQGGEPADVYLHYMKETAQQRIMPRAAKLEPPDIERHLAKLKLANRKAETLIQRLSARPGA